MLGVWAAPGDVKLKFQAKKQVLLLYKGWQKQTTAVDEHSVHLLHFQANLHFALVLLEISKTQKQENVGHH